MDMGESSSGSYTMTCKLSMLWNWYTIDACFISDQWHIRSKAAFAFTVLSVAILVALVEGVRRFGREYDLGLVRRARRAGSAHNILTKTGGMGPAPVQFKPTHMQQLVRASIFTIQFGATYITMLLAMYFNGYVIFAIILGGGVGHFIFARDTVVGAMNTHEDTGAS